MWNPKYINLATAEVVGGVFEMVKASIVDYIHFGIKPDWTKIGSPKYKRAFGYEADW